MHTPGPWKADDLIVYSEDNMRIANCSRLRMHHARASDAELYANALLIAAAPKMLDALRSIAYVMPRDHNGKISYKDAYESMVRVALGAISAATGDQ